ncbi:glycoside hydrolase family 10 protein [Xylariomycetidae sp. FL0641]|nr:glycoside hydrolase family 10 protein [Xylariomycetidae sp. FL0641]
MQLTFNLAAVAALAAAASATPTKTGSLSARASLSPYYHDLAVDAGKQWFGCALDTTGAEYQSDLYMQIWNDSRIFGSTTPGNTQKWMYTEPQQGVFDFSQADLTVQLAQQTGKKLRCHNLVWSSQLPSWVTSGSWTADTLAAAMKNHITTMINHFGDSCYSWDVVNEAASGDAFTDNIFLQVIGENYVAMAFMYAYQAVQAGGYSVKLFYNDYGIEFPGDPKTNFVINKILRGVQAWDPAYIQGVGMESHWSTDYHPSAEQVATIAQAYADLGLEVHITELDVACPTVPCDAAALAQQADAYYAAVKGCLAVDKCAGVTVWGFVDQFSWIQPESNDGKGDPCIFADNFVAKPASSAVSEAWSGIACDVC